MQSWIVILGLYIIATKTKYRNELNAAPYMIIHLFSMKSNKQVLQQLKSTLFSRAGVGSATE